MFASAETDREVSCSVLGMRIDETNYTKAVTKVLRWTEENSSRYVCISTVHMIMESHDEPSFRAVVNGADLVAADGVPVIWVARHLGLDQGRVFAPIVTLKLCEIAEQHCIPVGFYGSSDAVLRDLVANLKQRYPALNVAYCHSPPFRPLTAEEDSAIVADIKESGTRILFVGLGCPKQERWMAAHRGRFPATMLGVGWAFDVIAGHSRMAPEWVQRCGMEWFYRLILNPRRLWKRHLKNNPRFLVLIALQLLGLQRPAPIPARPE